MSISTKDNLLNLARIDLNKTGMTEFDLWEKFPESKELWNQIQELKQEMSDEKIKVIKQVSDNYMKKIEKIIDEYNLLMKLIS